MIARIKVTGNYEGAVYSAAGTVAAACKICLGEITNAFVFTGYGDHHAGSDFFGGGCYFNGAALAIHKVRERFDAQRFAIIDTDAHHGDGTWELFEKDPAVLYLCFCSGSSREENHNVNVHVPLRIGDDGYLALARNAFNKWIPDSQPEIIFWNWGYDGTIGEYGDLGLTPEFHLRVAQEIKKLAHDVCGGKLITILCGGSRRDLAFRLIPRIVEILAE
jgi:acetoin utilization deacetylase AcuC-like enzyme